MTGLIIATILYMMLISLVIVSDQNYVFISTRLSAIDVAIARDLYINELPSWSYWIRSELVASVFNP